MKKFCFWAAIACFVFIFSCTAPGPAISSGGSNASEKQIIWLRAHNLEMALLDASKEYQFHKDEDEAGTAYYGLRAYMLADRYICQLNQFDKAQTEGFLEEKQEHIKAGLEAYKAEVLANYAKIKPATVDQKLEDELEYELDRNHLACIPAPKDLPAP